MPGINTLARLLTGVAVLAAIGAHALPGSAQSLPPGVVHLGPGRPCPPALLCLYRDYNRSGPAYGIRAGYHVHLNDVPMPGGVGGPSAADNVSSWVNATDRIAVLIDRDDYRIRLLFPHQSLEEPPGTNDTVDVVRWVL